MRVTQAILPVAGLGTRFLPWTKVVPKELLPIGNKPVIAHIVDECIDAGILDICFVISRGKEAIPQFFYESPELEQELKKRGKSDQLAELKKYDEVDFHVVYQDEQHGDGHAILQAADWVKSDSVAILFGDDLFIGHESGLKQLLTASSHISDTAAIVALENIPRSETHHYGIVKVMEEEGRLKKLSGLVEKPDPALAPSTLGIVGRYIIPRSIFSVLPYVASSHGGEIRLIDALIAALPSTPIYGYECEGHRIDTGTPAGYAEAVKLLSNLS